MRTFFKYLGLAMMAVLPSLASAALQNGKVHVGFVNGKATLVDAQAKKKPLATGLVFQEGSQVETDKDSSAELVLSNGSTLIVSPDTLLELRTFRQVASPSIPEGSYLDLEKEPTASITEIEVKRGKVIGEVRHLNPMSSYVIKTPAGVARIRGTIYMVEYTVVNGIAKLTISCVKGAVEGAFNDESTGSEIKAKIDAGTAYFSVGSTGTGGGTGGTGDPIDQPGYTNQSKDKKTTTNVYKTDIDPEDLRKIADMLDKAGNIPKDMIKNIRNQADLLGDYKANPTNYNPDANSDKKTLTDGGTFIKNSGSGSSGGGGTGTDKILEQTYNPSATGG